MKFTVAMTYWDTDGWFRIDYFTTPRILVRWLQDYGPNVFKIHNIFPIGEGR